jgi:hypothetical protein
MDDTQHFLHPDVHRPASQWSEEQTLHLAVAYSNPFRWRVRRELANDFRRHMMAQPNVVLHFIELAYGDRPFEVTNPALYPTDIQVRTSHELWHKENLLNVAVNHFPSDWRYGAYLDADVQCTRYDWALETIHQLQHYEWVQLFSSYTNLSGKTIPGYGNQPIGSTYGFAYLYTQNSIERLPGNKAMRQEGSGFAASHMPGVKVSMRRMGGNPGLGWGFRRSAFDTVGGLLDKCILGSGDGFMAFGLAGTYDELKRYGIPLNMRHWSEVRNISAYTDEYRAAIYAWQERAARLTRNIGYVDQFVVHHYHGPKDRRGYTTRDNILIEEKYNPLRDVYYDWQGVLQLTPDKPRLRDRIRQYFLSRVEDIPHIPPHLA